MSDEIRKGTMKVVAKDREDCRYDTLDRKLSSTYSRTRSIDRQITERLQLISVAHKRRGFSDAASENPGIGTSVFCSQS